MRKFEFHKIFKGQSVKTIIRSIKLILHKFQSTPTKEVKGIEVE